MRIADVKTGEEYAYDWAHQRIKVLGLEVGEVVGNYGDRRVLRQFRVQFLDNETGEPKGETRLVKPGPIKELWGPYAEEMARKEATEQLSRQQVKELREVWPWPITGYSGAQISSNYRGEGIEIGLSATQAAKLIEFLTLTKTVMPDAFASDEEG